MGPIVIDCSGPRDEVSAQLAVITTQLLAARAITPSQLEALQQARTTSLAAYESALDGRKKLIMRGADRNTLPVLPATMELPPFVEVPHDALNDLAEIIAFVSGRVAKMDEHHAGCTIRMAPNDHRMAHRGITDPGWTVTISYASYPGFYAGEGAE